MVNEEYKAKVKREFGLCECGNDIEYLIKSSECITMFHINFIGELSRRATIKNPLSNKGYCFACYRKLFGNMGEQYEIRNMVIEKEEEYKNIKKLIEA